MPGASGLALWCALWLGFASIPSNPTLIGWAALVLPPHGRFPGCPGSPRLPVAMQATHARQQFHVAPMQAYTNRHLRTLCRLLSSQAVLWTEMEKADDLLASQAAAHRRLRGGPGERSVLQLGGRDIKKLEAACRLANEYGYDEINLNCGCPSVQSGGASDFGATLMLDPRGTADALRAMADVSVAPVSVKCRIGTHQRVGADGTLPTDDYRVLADFVHTVSSSTPVSHFVVHCRAAVLAGLSPSKNRCVPPLRPEFVSRLARESPALDVTLNGGIVGAAHVRQLLSAGPELAGVMAGRWVLSNPLDLAGLDSVLDAGGGGCEGGVGKQHNGEQELAIALKAVTEYGAYAVREAASGEGPVHEVAMPLLLISQHLQSIDEALCLVLAVGIIKERGSEQRRRQGEGETERE